MCKDHSSHHCIVVLCSTSATLGCSRETRWPCTPLAQIHTKLLWRPCLPVLEGPDPVETAAWVEGLQRPRSMAVLLLLGQPSRSRGRLYERCSKLLNLKILLETRFSLFFHALEWQADSTCSKEAQKQECCVRSRTSIVTVKPETSPVRPGQRSLHEHV